MRLFQEALLVYQRASNCVDGEERGVHSYFRNGLSCSAQRWKRVGRMYTPFRLRQKLLRRAVGLAIVLKCLYWISLSKKNAKQKIALTVLRQWCCSCATSWWSLCLHHNFAFNLFFYCNFAKYHRYLIWYGWKDLLKGFHLGAISSL